MTEEYDTTEVFRAALVLKTLSSVSFIGGCNFACSFDSGASFTIMSLSRITARDLCLNSDQSGFRNTLRDQIGQKLESFIDEEDYFRMKFENGVLLEFSNRVDDFKPPEAALFVFNNQFIVWRGPE